MKTFVLGNLPLIYNDEVTPGFLLQTPIKGLEGAKRRKTSNPRPGQHGRTVSGAFNDSMIVTLTGMIHSDDPVEYENLRRKFISATSLKYDANGYPLPVRCYFKTMANKEYYIDCYFDEPYMPYDAPNYTTFVIVAEVARSYVFGSTTVVSSNIQPPSGGGYIVPMNVPYISASSAGGAVDIYHPGDVEAFPYIDLVGPLTKPTITNVTTGGQIQVDYTIPSGSTARIWMYDQLITLNGSQSLLGQKTDISDWWTITPGNNQVNLNTASSSDFGYARVMFDPPYGGV